MKKILFPYQSKALEDILGFLFENKKLKSGLAVLPTGAGKSVLLSHLSQKLKGDSCLMIVPSQELLLQNYEAIVNEGGVCSLYSASVGKKDVSDLTLATIGSLKDKGEEFKGFKYIIVDEAHFKFNSTADESVFKSFLAEVKPKKLLGLTATPFMLDSVKGQPALKMLTNMRPKIFQDIIHVTQVSDVIKAGRWAKINYEKHPVNKSSLQVGGAEYTKESIDLFLRDNNVNNRICLKLSELHNQKTLTFVPTVEIAEKMSQWFNKKYHGKFSSAVVSALTPKRERLEIIRRFKDVNDTLNHVINYGTLAVGFDYPDLKYILCGRPTNSLSLFYQIVGRGCRVSPGKDYMTFYDFCDNTSFFGDIQNLTVENCFGGWKCFIGENLFTGYPLNCGISVTKSFLREPPRVIGIDYKMKFWFGKYENVEVFKTPKFYRDFILKGIQNNPLPNEKEVALRELLLKLNVKDIVDIFQSSPSK